MDGSDTDTRLTEAKLALLDGQKSDILAQPAVEAAAEEIFDTSQPDPPINKNRTPPAASLRASPKPVPVTSVGELSATENGYSASQDDPSLLQERLQIGLDVPVTSPPPPIRRTASNMPIPPSTPRQTLDSQPETPEATEEMEAAEDTPSTPVAKAVADLVEETSGPESRNEIDTVAAIFDDENPSNPVFVMGAYKEGAERSDSTVTIPPSTPQQTDFDEETEENEDPNTSTSLEGGATVDPVITDATPETPVLDKVHIPMFTEEPESDRQSHETDSELEIMVPHALQNTRTQTYPIVVLGAEGGTGERSISTITIPPSTPQEDIDIEGEDISTPRREEMESKPPLIISMLDGKPETPIGNKSDENQEVSKPSMIMDTTPETLVLDKVPIPTFTEEPESDRQLHKTDSEPEIMAPNIPHNTRTQTYPIVVLGAEGGTGERSISTITIPPSTPQEDIDTEGEDVSTPRREEIESKPPLIISILDGKPETPIGNKSDENQEISEPPIEPESEPKVEPSEEPASTNTGRKLDDPNVESSNRQVEDADLLSRRLGIAFEKPVIARPPPLERTVSTVPVPPLSPKRGSSSGSSVKSSPNVTTPPAEPQSRDNIPQELVQISEPVAEPGLSSTSDRSLSTITIPPSSPRSDLTSNPEEIVDQSRGSPIPALVPRDSGSIKLRLPKAGIPTVSVTPHEAGTPDLSFVDDARSERSVATSVMPIAPASPRFISPLPTPSLDQSSSSRDPLSDFQRRPSGLRTIETANDNAAGGTNDTVIASEAEQIAPDLQDAINSSFDNSNNTLGNNIGDLSIPLASTAPLDAVPEEPLSAGLPSPSRPSPTKRGSSTSWLPNQRNSGWFNTMPQSPGRPSLEVAEGEFAASPRARGPRDYPPESNHQHKRKSVDGCIIC